LYVPALLDATGELCENAEPCEVGIDVGPIVNASNPNAQFINVFQTTPALQDDLLKQTFSIMPVTREHEGYMRTALHRSLDGKKVANYGQYENFDQVNKMYYRLRTATSFASIAFKRLTVPMEFFGIPMCIGDRCIGSPPKLRNYTIEYVAVGNYANMYEVRVANTPTADIR
jgi:hypothetical protein